MATALGVYDKGSEETVGQGTCTPRLRLAVLTGGHVSRSPRVCLAEARLARLPRHLPRPASVCLVHGLPRTDADTIRDSTARCHGEPEGRVMNAPVLLPPPPLLSYTPPCLATSMDGKQEGRRRSTQPPSTRSQ
jgi:hypothetical protein